MWVSYHNPAMSLFCVLTVIDSNCWDYNLDGWRHIYWQMEVWLLFTKAQCHTCLHALFNEDQLFNDYLFLWGALTFAHDYIWSEDWKLCTTNQIKNNTVCNVTQWSGDGAERSRLSVWSIWNNATKRIWGVNTLQRPLSGSSHSSRSVGPAWSHPLSGLVLKRCDVNVLWRLQKDFLACSRCVLC